MPLYCCSVVKQVYKQALTKTHNNWQTLKAIWLTSILPFHWRTKMARKRAIIATSCKLALSDMYLVAPFFMHTFICNHIKPEKGFKFVELNDNFRNVIELDGKCVYIVVYERHPPPSWIWNDTRLIALYQTPGAYESAHFFPAKYADRATFWSMRHIPVHRTMLWFTRCCCAIFIHSFIHSFRFRNTSRLTR